MKDSWTYVWFLIQCVRVYVCVYACGPQVTGTPHLFVASSSGASTVHTWAFSTTSFGTPRDVVVGASCVAVSVSDSVGCRVQHIVEVDSTV